MNRHFHRLLAGTLVAGWLAAVAPAWGDIAADIELVKNAAAQSPMPANAQAAWKRVAGQPGGALLVLKAMDGAGPLETNALRMAFDAATEPMADSGAILDLREVVLDRSLCSKARTTVFELMVRSAPQVRGELVAAMLDDPAPELRYAAVADLLERADMADGEAALTLYRQAFAAAIDVEQKQRCANELEDLGEAADLASSLGYVLAWRVVGPFNNVDGVGFAQAYPPEDSTDAASYDGKDGTVSWVSTASDDDLGLVDLTKVLGPFKGAVAYAEAVIESPAAADAQVRYTTRNGSKLWVNGELINAANVYHSGHSIDQYVASCRLRKGENRILLKLCQNEQTEPWAQSWEFQCRVTDPIGAGAQFTGATPK
ncbi:hypothetical protein Pla175_20760 [Pirellulimonas nuda]|uniref:Uncharacterized protein n=1 Tax=Pirellulimonas nuda TaxID=2528009 RepID=A0A518DB38_9BACT|nr:hypothetical protein Pla175_20760 [Pirellulimonas nuda]